MSCNYKLWGLGFTLYFSPSPTLAPESLQQPRDIWLQEEAGKGGEGGGETVRISPSLVGNTRNALDFVGNILQNVSMALFGSGLVLHLSESSPKKPLWVSLWQRRDVVGCAWKKG